MACVSVRECACACACARLLRRHGVVLDPQPYILNPKRFAQQGRGYAHARLTVS
jgi:hypothetical protein